MILRLHHHRDIWQRWKLRAQGLGLLLGAWSDRWWLRSLCTGVLGAAFCIAVRRRVGFPSQPQQLPLPV